MTANLVRHHPVFDGLPKLLGIAAASSLTAINLVFFQQAKADEAGIWAGSSFPWFALIVFASAAAILFRGADRRAREWHLGLPLPAGRLWLAHGLALLGGTLGILYFQGILVSLFLGLMQALTHKIFWPWSDLLLTFVRPTVVLVCLSTWVLAYRPDLAALSGHKTWRRDRFILACLGEGLLVALFYLPLWVTLLPLMLSLGWAARAAGAVPPTLELGSEPGLGGGAAGAEAWDSLARGGSLYGGGGPRLSVHILNQVSKIPYPWTWLFAVFGGFFAVLLAGVPLLERSFDSEILRLQNVFMAVYILFAFFGEFTFRLHKVDHLPVDRRALLRYIALPGVLVFVLFYGGGRVAEQWRAQPHEHIHFQDAYGKFGAAVSPAFSSLARRGSEIEVQAPWGETHVARARHKVPNGLTGLAAQSPFLTEGETSRRFLAWQLSRAVEHVYGRWIEPARLDSLYIRLDEEGKFHIPIRDFTVAHDFGLRARHGGPVAPLLLAPIIGGFFLVAGLYFRLLHRPRTMRSARIIFWVFMGGLLMLHMVHIVGRVPLWNPFGGAVLVFSTARQLGELGMPGTVGTYVTGLVLVWACWQFCVRMFRGVEAPRG